MARADAMMKVVSGEERPFAKVNNAPKLMKGSHTLRYEGELEGEGVLGELKICLTDQLSTMYGLERFSGSLAGRKGTFVLQHTGFLRDGVLISKRTVLPGSGTGDLRGLKGELLVGEAPQVEMRVSFVYDFLAAQTTPAQET
jgi:hypothetical protein